MKRKQFGSFIVGVLCGGCRVASPPTPDVSFATVDTAVGEVFNVVVADANTPATQLTLQVENPEGRVISRVAGTSPFSVRLDWAGGPYTFTVANALREVSVVDVDRDGFPGFVVTDDTLTIPIEQVPAGSALDDSTVTVSFPLLPNYLFIGADQPFRMGIGTERFLVAAVPGVPFHFFAHGNDGEWATYSSPGVTMPTDVPLAWSPDRSSVTSFAGRLPGTIGVASIRRVIAGQPAQSGPVLGWVTAASNGTYAGEFFDQPGFELVGEFTVNDRTISASSTVWVEGRAALTGATQPALPFVEWWPGPRRAHAAPIPFTFPNDGLPVRMVVAGISTSWSIHVSPDTRAIRVPVPINLGNLRRAETFASISVCDPAPAGSRLACIRQSNSAPISLSF